MKPLDKAIKSFCDRVVASFGSNLEGIVQYGSTLYDTENFTDLDIVIVLKSREDSLKDVTYLREVRTKFNRWNLDLQLIYTDEIFHPDYFSLDAHGVYFLEILKRSKTLYGINSFKELGRAVNNRYSVISQIQNYVFRARQEAMGMPKLYKDKSVFYHKKKMKNIMNDLLILHGYSFEQEYQKTLEIFQEKFHFFDNSDLKFLKTTTSNNVDDFIYYYNRLYFFGIEYIKEQFLAHLKVERGRYEDIIYEYVRPKKQNGNLLILLDGLPSVPKRNNLMKMLAGQGFCVVFPRYAGTWESGGEFLKSSPTNDIELLIKHLKKDFGEIQYVSVLTTSFGAAVGLDISSNLIKKAVHLSPVTSFTSLKEKLKGLDDYLISSYGQVYRFKKVNWRKIMDEKYFNPNKQNIKKVKSLIIGGGSDKTISILDLKNYCSKNKARLIELKDLGHVNFSDLEENASLFSQVIDFLK